MSKLPVGVEQDEPTRMNFRKPDFRAAAHECEIISSSPVLAVPGWLDNHNAPKPEAVVPALNMTARASGDCSKACVPLRQAITK